MTEKVKGMFGSETRADEVKEWLKNQGADAMQSIENFKDSEAIYYVDKDKEISKLHSSCAELFDIVELSRWRAIKAGIYFYVTDRGCVDSTFDTNELDADRYECGNYFKTKEEAEPYAEKIREIFKRKEKG